jgi:hypothetical protein
VSRLERVGFLLFVPVSFAKLTPLEGLASIHGEKLENRRGLIE